MDGNRDESQRCILLAKQYLVQGNIEKCTKFLNKAQRLYPSDEAECLLSRLKSQSNSSEESKQNSANQNHSDHGNSQFNHSGTRQRTASNGSTGENFSKEQVEAVRKIRRCKDYYEILGVQKEASDDEIKRAYKKLALKYHPDKNQAPGAAEAFKAIGNAFAVLSDSSKRKRYDQFGSEESVQSSNGYRTYQYDYTRGFESDISPEDLFNMFFGGGFNSAHVHRHRNSHTHTRESERENNYFMCLQLLPLFLLFGMSFFSGLFVREPQYSLVRSSKYPNSAFTSNLQIPYYIKQTFHQDFDGNLRQLEAEVEEEYMNQLRIKCYKEQQYRENLLFKARYYGNEESYRHAQNMETPNCRRLEKLYGG